MIRYIIIILSCNLFFSCLDVLPELEETPFEDESSIEMIRIKGDLTQRYLADEWETFIYLDINRDYMDNRMFVWVIKDGEPYKTASIRSDGSAQFYDLADFNATHCYSFAIGRIDSGMSKVFTPDYCIDFK